MDQKYVKTKMVLQTIQVLNIIFVHMHCNLLKTVCVLRIEQSRELLIQPLISQDNILTSFWTIRLEVNLLSCQIRSITVQKYLLKLTSPPQ